MSDTIQQYKDYVITSFMKAVQPVVVESAEGCIIHDASGKEYLDCFAGISVVNAGHCNPKVIAAAKAQMDKLVHCASYIYYSPATGALAEKMAQIMPSPRLRKSFFANSGAEAIEGAMKVARLYSGKHEIISLQASFHGRTWGTLSITGNQGRKKRGGPYASGVAFAPAPYVYRSPWPDDPRALRRFLEPDAGRDHSLLHRGRRSSVHRRAGDGRGRHHRPPARLFPRDQEGARPARHPVHLRRGPVRLRPHRQDVRHRALRRRARHHGHRQGHRRRLPAGGVHHARRNCRLVQARRSPLHLRRQSRFPVPRLTANIEFMLEEHLSRAGAGERRVRDGPPEQAAAETCRSSAKSGGWA